MLWEQNEVHARRSPWPFVPADNVAARQRAHRFHFHSSPSLGRVSISKCIRCCISFSSVCFKTLLRKVCDRRWRYNSVRSPRVSFTLRRQSQLKVVLIAGKLSPDSCEKLVRLNSCEKGNSRSLPLHSRASIVEVPIKVKSRGDVQWDEGEDGNKLRSKAENGMCSLFFIVLCWFWDVAAMDMRLGRSCGGHRRAQSVCVRADRVVGVAGVFVQSWNKLLRLCTAQGVALTSESVCQLFPWNSGVPRGAEASLNYWIVPRKPV